MNINTNYISTNLYTSQDFTVDQRKKTKTLEVLTADQNHEKKIYTTVQNSSYLSEFGFRVDEQGIFEKDLNRMANLPLSYDINVKSVWSIAKEFAKQDGNFIPSKMDLPQILNQYYSVLKAVEPEFLQKDNGFLNRGEVFKFFQGFSTRSGEFNSQIIRVYEDMNALKKALLDNKNLSPLNLENKIISFNFDSAINNTANNEFIKDYLNKDAQISKAGLLMNFVHKDIQSKNEEISFFIEPTNLNFTKHQKFYQMFAEQGEFENYLHDENKNKISFDLYLYMNGIDKKNSNNDKLSILYQQYLNYHKDLNIQEFIDSSSIYQLYIQSLSDNFKQIQNEYLQQSNQEQLNTINHTRQNSVENFYIHRKKQAKTSKIIQSYLTVLS